MSETIASVPSSSPPPPPVRAKTGDDIRPPSLPPPVSAPGGSSPFSVLKPNQGTYVRWCTAIGAGLLAVGLAQFLYDQLRVFQRETIQLVVPAIVLVASAYLIFWLVGRNQRAIDFMIATEGEMKKVNWSTRREVLGATRVVIFTFVALGFVLFLVDVFFIIIFELMGILRLGMLEGIMGVFQPAG